nr:hypothetical protein Iba_chr11fCG2890 [Ipomoea batatas]
MGGDALRRAAIDFNDINWGTLFRIELKRQENVGVFLLFPTMVGQFISLGFNQQKSGLQLCAFLLQTGNQATKILLQSEMGVYHDQQCKDSTFILGLQPQNQVLRCDMLFQEDYARQIFVALLGLDDFDEDLGDGSAVCSIEFIEMEFEGNDTLVLLFSRLEMESVGFGTLWRGFDLFEENTEVQLNFAKSDWLLIGDAVRSTLPSTLAVSSVLCAVCEPPALTVSPPNRPASKKLSPRTAFNSSFMLAEQEEGFRHENWELSLLRLLNWCSKNYLIVDSSHNTLNSSSLLASVAVPHSRAFSSDSTGSRSEPKFSQSSPMKLAYFKEDIGETRGISDSKHWQFPDALLLLPSRVEYQWFRKRRIPWASINRIQYYSSEVVFSKIYVFLACRTITLAARLLNLVNILNHNAPSSTAVRSEDDDTEQRKRERHSGRWSPNVLFLLAPKREKELKSTLRLLSRSNKERWSKETEGLPDQLIDEPMSSPRWRPATTF